MLVISIGLESKNFQLKIVNSFLSIIFIPPANFVCGGYTVFTLSVRPSVRNVLFFYLEESLLDFHQTLQTCSYMQDKYFRQKSKG